MENKYNRDLYTHGLESYEAEIEKNTNGRDFVFGVVLGTVVGGIVGLLLAPKPGRELQDDINEKSNQILGDVKSKTEDLKQQAQVKAEEVKVKAEDKKEQAQAKVDEAKAKSEKKTEEAKKKVEEVKSKNAEKKADKNVVTADDVDNEELKAQKSAIQSEVQDDNLKGPKTVVDKKSFDK